MIVNSTETTTFFAFQTIAVGGFKTIVIHSAVTIHYVLASDLLTCFRNFKVILGESCQAFILVFDTKLLVTLNNMLLVFVAVCHVTVNYKAFVILDSEYCMPVGLVLNY